MMLDLAEALDPLLDRRAALKDAADAEADDEDDTTLQLVFFDGEEAFKDWTHTDSVYGARCVHSAFQSQHTVTCPSLPQPPRREMAADVHRPAPEATAASHRDRAEHNRPPRAPRPAWLVPPAHTFVLLADRLVV